jgi:peptide/nickel transport system permease protein
MVAEALPAQKSPGYWRLVARQYRKRKMAVAALFFLLFLGITAIVAPFLASDRPIYMVLDGKSYLFPNLVDYKALRSVDFRRWAPGEGEYALRTPIPHGPHRFDLYNRFCSPTVNNPLGTDTLGRDVLTRLIWGARVSMSIGFVAEGIAVVIGVIIGALAGFYGGKVDVVILRIVEIVMLFPVFVLIITLISFLPPSIYNIMIVLGLVGWTTVARLVRGEFLKLRESEFALAARASGLRDSRIMFRHLLPNALSPVLVSATFGVAGAILIESALSFLGFGVPPPTASWGELLYQSKAYLHRGAWWLAVFPGIAIFSTVTAFNLVGNGLRDAMDPRMRE